MLLSKNHERLSGILSHLNLTQDLPLLKSLHIPSSYFTQLTNSANYFLYANLAKYFKDKIFEFTEDMLERYPDEIQALPCITPNGMILPKRETFLEYNLVYHAVTRIMAELGIDEHIHSACKNIHLRLVDGRPDPILDSRPYSSVKLHTDIWVGDPVNIIQVFIPLLGDTENTDVSFFEPEEFVDDYIRTLNDYAEGESMKSNKIKYDTTFKKGEVFFTDSFLLHKTIKRNGGLRLSIDFRFMPKKKIIVGRPKNEEDILLANYIDLAKWYDIGFGKVLTSEDHLEPFKPSASGKKFSHLNFGLVDLLKTNEY
jgi:hypothetical protein